MPAAALDETDRDAMWALYAAYYTEVTRAGFERDLAEKDHVIVLRRGGALRGFSTLKRLEGEVLGQRFLAVFSGDTILDRAEWGQVALQRAFLAYVMRVKLRHPLLPVFWFLISKGYRTYLLLSRNFVDYWPRPERPTPPFEEAVIDSLARQRWPEAWQPGLGVLRFASPQGRLREEVAPIDEAMRERHPDIGFFSSRNPGHVRGEELCCLGRVDLQLWLSYMLKLARRLTAPAGRERGATEQRGAACAG